MDSCPGIANRENGSRKSKQRRTESSYNFMDPLTKLYEMGGFSMWLFTHLAYSRSCGKAVWVILT